MNSMQTDVETFHKAFNIPVGKIPAIRRPELRAELIREESRELRKAIEQDNLVEAIDGMCDLIIVTLGTAIEFGIDLEPFFDEVHRTNMTKVGGEKRADGKQLKPKGWTPPDIKGILEKIENME